MRSTLQHLEPLRIGLLIHLVRGQRVLLDEDLARLYEVPTKQLVQQLRRNSERFPSDFAFQLTRKEYASFRTQVAAPSEHGGRRHLPFVFTEHGAIMLATVLNSPIAIEASVRVVRAFVHLREMLASNKDLASKLAELERRLGGHDKAIKSLFDAIKQLLDPPDTDQERREIGFHIKEEARKYTTRNGVH